MNNGQTAQGKTTITTAGEFPGNAPKPGDVLRTSHWVPRDSYKPVHDFLEKTRQRVWRLEWRIGRVRRKAKDFVSRRVRKLSRWKTNVAHKYLYRDEGEEYVVQDVVDTTTVTVGEFIAVHECPHCEAESPHLLCRSNDEEDIYYLCDECFEALTYGGHIEEKD